ncbi:MAG: ribosome maturation factor RimP [Deltaproteobacteria bacterium]|nr:ribosome maturation factor RimP [Deltaproteobacteria bacterium]
MDWYLISDIAARTKDIIEPTLNNLGLELVEIEYVKEQRGYTLRMFIDSPTGVTVEDCAQTSRLVGDIIEAEGVISDSYHLEVSSPGLDRRIRKESDFRRFLNHEIKVKTRTPEQNRRNFTGTLAQCENGVITVLVGQQTFSIRLDNVAKANLVFHF